jgi:hypothetical protein
MTGRRTFRRLALSAIQRRAANGLSTRGEHENTGDAKSY